MKHARTIKTLLATTAAAFIAMPTMATGSDGSKPMADKSKVGAADAALYSDRERMALWTDEKQRLESMLKPGQTKAVYMKTLAQNGYTLTSINADQTDYLEYEVVKDSNPFEVQIDLDNAGRGDTIKVESNVWRADATKSVLRGNRMEQEPRHVPANANYSDRARMAQWTNEKDMLEKALGKGKPVAFYTGELKRMGYRITSSNANERDYVEMEIVKGQSTYEVQIDLDETGKATEVDVTTNMWQSSATENALEKNFR